MRLLDVTPEPHPLQRRLRAAGIQLWRLSKALKGLYRVSESALSRYMSGVSSIPPELEANITKLIQDFEKEESKTKKS